MEGVFQIRVGIINRRVYESSVPPGGRSRRQYNNNKQQQKTTCYIQLSPCGHLAILDTPLLRTEAEVQGNKNY